MKLKINFNLVLFCSFLKRVATGAFKIRLALNKKFMFKTYRATAWFTASRILSPSLKLKNRI